MRMHEPTVFQCSGDRHFCSCNEENVPQFSNCYLNIDNKFIVEITFDLLNNKIFGLIGHPNPLLSLESKNFTTIPAAMEEVDTLSLKMENETESFKIKEQIYQYNIYINFLSDYYSDSNPKPILFDESLSKRLFG